MIDIGKLNKRVLIQYKSVTRSSYGNENITWTTEATVWANIKPLSAFQREFFTNLQERAELSHVITMRYRTGVTPTKRLKYGNREFDIESVVDVDERHEELRCNVKEVVI